MENLILRINELAKKSKAEGLTEAEKQEQALLRKKYIELFKGNLTKTLESCYIVDEAGNKHKVTKKNK